MKPLAAKEITRIEALARELYNLAVPPDELVHESQPAPEKTPPKRVPLGTGGLTLASQTS